MTRYEKIEVINRVVNHLQIRYKDEEHRKLVIEYFMSMTEIEMLKPIFVHESNKGMSHGQIAQKHGVTSRIVQYHVLNDKMHREN